MTLRRFALIILIGIFPGSNAALAAADLDAAYVDVVSSEGDDHGNSRASATSVALPSTTTGTIDPGNDTDWFRFKVPVGGTVVMESRGDLDTLATLFDARGNRTVQDDDSAGYPNFRIERTLEVGIYYVRVHSSGRATGGYTLHLRGDDHGNSRASATRLALPSATGGTIDPGNDTDWFRFEVPVGGTVVMESRGDLDALGTLFDAGGNRMVQDDDGGDNRNFLIERTLDSGTYYVSVHSFGSATGGYTLHLRGDDHGNSLATATRVALPSTTTGTIYPGDDTDWFRFEASAGGVVVMESRGTVPDTGGTLFDAGGNRMVQDDSSGWGFNFRIVRTLDVDTYYLRVNSYNRGTGSYTLHLLGDDHGNTRSTATRVALPSTTTGTIVHGTDTVRPSKLSGNFDHGIEADTDWFRFEVPVGGTVVMESSGDLDTLGTLFDPRGNRPVQDDDGAGYPNFRIERTLDAGAYYVRVHTPYTATGGYTLHLRGDGGGGSATVAPGESFRDCDTCPLMVSVPAGSFSMGAPESEPESRDDERPQRTVSVPAFAAGAFEVTFAEWDACVAEGGCGGYSPDGDSPDGEDWGRGERPVIYVSWDDAQLYVEWLSRKTGQTYRLPTEAEWEYAARAGTTTPFHTGETISPQQANFDGSHGYPGGSEEGGVYRRQTVPVGSFAPNAFGLHDVHGNVWEWVQDCYGSYANAPTDGSSSEVGSCRVLRGGSWDNDPGDIRSASRIRYDAGHRGYHDGITGFRVVRTLAPEIRDCDVCPLMVSVPAGSFVMGAPESEPSDNNERPQRTVSVPAFAMGAFEVTFAEWDACVAEGGCDGYRPDDFGWGRRDRPVVDVAWGGAQLYVEWLSRKTGQTYRLPTEAEWEYAARAGTTTPFHTGRTISPHQANFDDRLGYPDVNGGSGLVRSQTVPVGSFAPNAFGLYDMHGNVSEHVEDCYTGYDGAPTDGSAREITWPGTAVPWCRSGRVIRGGSWRSPPGHIRSASRNHLFVDGDSAEFWSTVNGVDDRGFRVARTLAP